MPERLRLTVRGVVQGVGFRPFVHRLARELDLDGWVQNSPQGVALEVEGPRAALDAFLERLTTELPTHAAIHGLEPVWLEPVPHRGFAIRPSADGGPVSTLVLPDVATCEDCRREIVDPADRRYRYPFTNCTHCGPRYSIIRALPYDRAHTSMSGFDMCPACLAEYRDPSNRRFHAQPNACPECGPHLELWDGDGTCLAARDAALRAAADAIRRGRIVALKGLGGFQLLVDAANEEAVSRLRERKHREEKPLAVMYPAVQAVVRDCTAGPLERRLLQSPEAPIVLLARRPDGRPRLAPSIAPGNPSVGVMLPCTPLHHLLLADLGRPVVATSGNLSDEPMCTDEHEALARLQGVADVWLVHDRPIVRHVDDSVVRIVLDRELVIRRARGYAPLPVHLAVPAPPAVAVGAHLKNTVAVVSGRHVFVSQHLGDLETTQSVAAFGRALADIGDLFQVVPETVIADMHPDYHSTREAAKLGLPMVRVQHHLAHVAAALADNDLDGPALGVSWDGTGYGPDGTVWGGEFLDVAEGAWRRVACLRPFRLPGGDRAVRDPRRSALGLVHAAAPGLAADTRFGERLGFSPAEHRALTGMLARRVNAPVTTSAGRLFDALACLAGVASRITFEGQAAMAFEWAVDPGETGRYPFALASGTDAPALGTWAPPDLVVDWWPMVRAALDDVADGRGAGVVAARVHHTLAAAIVEVARHAGRSRVVLTGGCFQNRVLTELAVAGLRLAGLRPSWPQRVPPNDGGIALGQVAAWQLGLTGRPAADGIRIGVPAASGTRQEG